MALAGERDDVLELPQLHVRMIAVAYHTNGTSTLPCAAARRMMRP
jgi:hypothetical protein